MVAPSSVVCGSVKKPLAKFGRCVKFAWSYNIIAPSSPTILSFATKWFPLVESSKKSHIKTETY